eukprot:g13984.t1
MFAVQKFARTTQASGELFSGFNNLESRYGPAQQASTSYVKLQHAREPCKSDTKKKPRLSTCCRHDPPIPPSRRDQNGKA